MNTQSNRPNRACLGGALLILGIVVAIPAMVVAVLSVPGVSDADWGGAISAILSAAAIGAFLIGVVIVVVGARLWRAAGPGEHSSDAVPRTGSLYQGITGMLVALAILGLSFAGYTAWQGARREVNFEQAEADAGMVPSEFGDTKYVEAPDDERRSEAESIVLGRLGGSFKPLGVYVNNSGTYRVWVASAEYKYAQYIFRVLEVDGALRWADTASQSNMLMLATRFSRDVHEELYESDKIYSCPLVVGGLVLKQGWPSVAEYEGPTGPLVGSLGPAFLQENRNLLVSD